MAFVRMSFIPVCAVPFTTRMSIPCLFKCVLLSSTPRYGVGYHMVIEKAPTCDSTKVVDIVKSIVPDGKCVLDIGAELSFILPSQATSSFPSLFEELECMSVYTCTMVLCQCTYVHIHVHVNEWENLYNFLHPFSAKKGELGIDGFGVSVTTMEEVFLRVRDGTAESIERRCVLNNVLSWLWLFQIQSLTSGCITPKHLSTSLHTSIPNTQLQLPVASMWNLLWPQVRNRLNNAGYCLNRTLEHRKCICTRTCRSWAQAS